MPGICYMYFTTCTYIRAEGYCFLCWGLCYNIIIHHVGFVMMLKTKFVAFFSYDMYFPAKNGKI